MRIYPAVHYTMGGLWVDYELMSTIPGLFVGGEANFSDHGANRLGASALMQGLADGYFILPYTVGDYLARGGLARIDVSHAAFRDAEAAVQTLVRSLLDPRDSPGRPLPPRAREPALERLRHGPHAGVPDARALRDPQAAGGVLARPSPGGHGRGAEPGPGAGRPRGRLLRAGGAPVPGRAGARRIVRRTLPGGAPDRGGRGPPRRRAFAHVAAWEWRGPGERAVRHEEPLAFETVPLQARSYK